MTAMNQAYRDRQVAQLERFLEWQRAQGGRELPTKLTTLLRPAQQARIRWLREHARGRILEVGCNFGFVLASVGGQVGVDIEEWNVELARVLCPDLEFQVADARYLPFSQGSFETVILADILEHLLWPDEVHAALLEAQRVARERVLITMPDGRQDTEEACNFKHAWVLDEGRLDELLKVPASGSWRVNQEFVAGFACIEARRVE